MYNLDEIITKKEEETIQLEGKVWTLNFSTRTGLFVSSWIERNRKKIEGDNVNLDLNEFVELLSAMVIESEFKDIILDLEPQQLTEAASYVLEIWNKKFTTIDGKSLKTQKKNL